MIQKSTDLSGKVAVVTGGAGVPGFAIADGLTQAGVKIGILGRTNEKLQQKVGELKTDQINAPLLRASTA